MVPSPRSDIVAVGLSRLTDAFKGTNVEGVVKAWLLSVQDLNNVKWQVLNAVLNPTGQMLDNVAAIVGETRNGRSDTEFLAAYKLRILVNRSNGLADDIIKVARALVPTATYDEGDLAAWQVTAYNPSSPKTLMLELGRAKSGASRGVLRFTQWPSSTTTKWRWSQGATTATPTNWNSTAITGFGNMFCSSQEVGV